MGLFEPIHDDFISLDDTPTTYSGGNYKYVRVDENQDKVYFNTVIGGVTVSGTTPPDPNEASVWYNTNDLILYRWDPARDEWLSTDLHNYLFSYQGAVSGLYMSIGNVGHEDVYYYIPRPACITGQIMAAENKGEDTKTYQIIDGATVLDSFTGTNYKYQNMAAKVNLDFGAELKVFCTSAGQAARNPVIVLEIRWRYVP